MSAFALFFDVAPGTSTVGAVAAVIFLFALLGVAFLAFKVLKRTVKMAFRMTVVAVILLVAVVGSLSLWYFSSGPSPRPRPPAERQR